MVNFRGNAHTKKKTAELFAKFRAIENCRDQGKKVANILHIRDQSQSKNVLRSSGYPSYYYGMSPFYSRGYSGIGVGIGTSSTWEETYTYPEFDVVFVCTDKAMGPELVIRQVSAEEMKLLVKDLRGALQVEKVLENSTNTQAIEIGDVILRAEGKRIEKIPQLLSLFTPEHSSVKVELMREGVKKSAVLRSVDVTELIEGSQKSIIEDACKEKEIKERKICK